jgi:hypothetical protein
MNNSLRSTNYKCKKTLHVAPALWFVITGLAGKRSSCRLGGKLIAPARATLDGGPEFVEGLLVGPQMMLFPITRMRKTESIIWKTIILKVSSLNLPFNVIKFN